MPIDIFDADFQFPQTTYILAPGIKGKAHWHRIPNDAFVIAVNYAVEIPAGIPKNIWMAEDSNLPRLYAWFRDAAKEYIAKGYLFHEPWPTPVFDSGYLYRTYPNVPYTYDSASISAHLGNVDVHHKAFSLIPGLLRGRATISSKAMQMAVQKGARKLILCGVDMWGEEYFDGKLTRSGYVDETGEWIFTERLNGFIEWLQGEGIEVVSLSQTALDVEVI